MKIINKTVRRDFELLEILEAGIVLTGAEVKSVKAGNMKLKGAYVRIIGNEVYLVNAQIAIYEHARPENYDSARSRKLLLHRKEILRLQVKIAGASASNLTIVPLACYNKKYNIKIAIALAKGKKGWQKKRVEQRRDEERRVEKEMKEQLKK